MKAGIYEHYNLVNGRSYVGKTKDLRSRTYAHYRMLNNGTHHCTPFQRAWVKYGTEAFELRIVWDFDHVPESVLDELLNIAEAQAVAARGSKAYNLTEGGGGGMTMKPETKLKMGKAQRAWWDSLTPLQKEEAINRFVERIRKALDANDGAQRKARSVRLTAMNDERWSDPANHEKHSQKMREVQSDPLYKLLCADRTRASWRNPTHRMNRENGMDRSWEDGSTGRKNRLDAMHLSWKDGSRDHQNKKPWSDDRHKNHSRGVTSAWNDPIKRANILEGMRKARERKKQEKENEQHDQV